jgi:PAS domain S-box-containing protein
MTDKPYMDENVNAENSLGETAEDQLGKSPLLHPELKNKTPEAVIHELHVYQTELEIQNDELQRVQLALEQSKNKYLDLYDFSPVAYFTLSSEGLIVEANLTGASLLGLPRPKLINKRFGRFVASESEDQWYRCMMVTIKNDRKQVCDLTLQREDGSSFFAHLENIRIEASNKQGDLTEGAYEIRMAVADITERKRNEDDLRRELEISSAISAMFEPLLSPLSEIRDLAEVVGEKARSLTNSAHCYVNETDPATGDQVALTLTEMFGAACSMEGPLPARFPLGTDGRYRGLWGHSLNTRRSFFTNNPAEHLASKGLPKGHVPLRSFLSVPVTLDGELVGQIAVANSTRDYNEKDIAAVERIARYYALGIQRKRYREDQALLTSAVDQAAEAVIVTDAEGKVKYVNPAYSEITGYMEDEIIDRQISVLMYQGQDKDAYRSMWDALNTGGKWTGRLTNKRKDGGNYHENVSVSSINDDMGRITNLVFVSRDVSEEVKLQDQLIQSQKMEAIGTLAGGIAHEFNNVLFAIMGHVELVMDDVPEGSRARLNLEKVLNAVERCSDMVKQILTFSRPKRTKMIPLDLSPLVKDAINFLRSTIPTTIEINQRIEPDQKSVLGDTTQIHQLLMNLCLNASQAMENGKGTMSVELGEVVLDESFAALNPPLVPGRYMRLVVADTGCGISPEIEKKIFDPYFTTKEVGKGTGMGLAVVQGIVRNHNGAITVSSDLGKGSIFSVFLPVLENKESRHEADSFDKIAPRGNEHILLVDDEPAVVEMLKIQLKRLGYKVTCSLKPEDALELFRQDPHRFDVVITDLTMPKMNGLELAEKLSFIRLGLPIILCTGMNQVVSTPDVKEAGISLVIQKPASRSEMAQAVRKVLEWKL